MARSRKKVPEHIRCANPSCGHLMFADSYSAHVPPDTPKDRIHRVLEPDQPYRTVLCVCGHFTVHVRTQGEAMQ